MKNILFWEPRRAVLYQHGEKVDDQPLDTPETLLAILGRFLEFAPQAIAEWEAAVAHFKDIIPQLGKALAGILKKARKENPAYAAASDRLGESGVVCYVSNNGFVDGIASDGMRKHLAEDFDIIYVLNLGGNVRKNPKLSGTTHNVFGIQVGVCVTVLVRLPKAGVSGRVGVPPAGSGILPERSSASPTTPEIGACVSGSGKIVEAGTPRPAGGTPTLPDHRGGGGEKRGLAMGEPT